MRDQKLWITSKFQKLKLYQTSKIIKKFNKNQVNLNQLKMITQRNKLSHLILCKTNYTEGLGEDEVRVGIVVAIEDVAHTIKIK